MNKKDLYRKKIFCRIALVSIVTAGSLFAAISAHGDTGAVLAL